VCAVEAAVDQQLVPAVCRARRRDDRPLDLASELAKRPTRGFEPEPGKGADRPGAERDACCPPQELAPVDRPTLRCDAGDYELEETALRRRSAVARPQRKSASPADEIQPNQHSRPIPSAYSATVSIQLQIM
jgi:hypothetical protein